MVGPPPLTGLKVLEFAGLAPAPFAGLILADAGAQVLRIDRPDTATNADALARRKSSITVDMATPNGQALLQHLAAQADVLIDPFRPGVLERRRLGPADLCPLNPRLVYARLSGFRRNAADSRYATMAGHDINYLAVSGVLAQLGRRDAPPTPPANLAADFAGGGAMLVLGVLLALLRRDGPGYDGGTGGGGGSGGRDSGKNSGSGTGRGQVVEANMVDGSSYVASFLRFLRKTPAGSGPRGANLLDSGAPFYDAYATRDGGWMAVGALEPPFFAALVRGLGLQDRGWEARQTDRRSWAEMRRVFGEQFARRTRREWEAVFDGTDACCTPVLDYGELEADPLREGDQRPPVALSDTPLLGVQGGREAGYVGTTLAPGQGGEAMLKDWLGWTAGKEYEIGDAGFVLAKSKL